ncbi:phage tail tube protein [Spartinivicinus ruber]|uniref:phage tail tube protein n=1 Tax=Spartinivicinus ruber TaxID=2683272 RepID=UPI0013D72886|nr:phage tail tube protein [Spartinivicinus ruber]
MADGSRHSMSLVLETTPGQTPEKPEFEPIRHTGTTLALTKNTLQSEEIRADRQITDLRHGSYQVGGDISIELSHGSFDTILEATLCGTWQEDSPVADTDELKVGTVRRSFTIERKFADLDATANPYHRFRGCEFNSLQLQINADSMVTGTVSVVGRGMSTASDVIADSTYKVASTTSPLDSFTGSLKEAGNPIAVITEIQLTLENGLEARNVVGSKESIAPSIGQSNVSGQISAYFEDSTLINKFIDEIESSIEFTLPDGTGNEYTFVLPRIKYTGGQPDVSGASSIVLTMPFQALLDSVTGSNLIIRRKSA